MEISDESLMERVQQGDLEAYADLFRRHHARLYAFLTRFTGCAALAEDLTQDVFYKVWTQRRTFRRAGSFVTWSYAIAKHAALDARKRHRREAAFADPDPLVHTDGEARRGDTGAGLDETVALRAAVRSALLALPENQQLAVVLSDYEGRSSREIGEILGCSENNARLLAHRGRRALRERLREWVPTGGEPCRKR